MINFACMFAIVIMYKIPHEMSRPLTLRCARDSDKSCETFHSLVSLIVKFLSVSDMMKYGNLL